jgi:hypothetical protein
MLVVSLAAMAAVTAFCQEGEGAMQVRPPDPSRIRCSGIFGSPDDLWKKGATLADYHINTVFVSHAELTDELIRRCHREGAKVYAEFGVFAGAATAEKYPELWPINEKGEPQARDDWYLGLCPNVEWYRDEKVKLIGECATKYDIDGLWLDFIRFPGHWEVHQPRLEQGCFNEACLEAFTQATGTALPGGDAARKAQFILSEHADDWTRFKREAVRDFCRDARRALKAARPNALLGAFVVPWTEGNYDDAIHRVIAQDFALLAPELDVFSPMSYHAMCGWPIEWVGQFNEYLTRKTGRDVWPIVQATEREGRYGDAPVDADAFRKALTQGLSGGATGVLMFRLADCTEDNGKLAVIRDVYGEFAR